MSREDTIQELKANKHVQKFMRRYRYQYHVTMLPDLAELAYTFYLEGYNNGLGQHAMSPELLTPGTLPVGDV